MKDDHKSSPVISLVAAFLLGVILLLSFGKDWLHFESILVLLSGLVGVALAVILARAWEIHRHSGDDRK